MDINKNEILLQNFIPKLPNKDISLNNNMIDIKTPQNKIRLLINKTTTNTKISPNKLTIENYNKLINSNEINIKTEKKVNKSLLLNKNNTLNEITLNSLAQENNLLKKEIEIVKSNLIISDEKEKLHKKTLQKIKKINKENEITYKNSINLINEYKKREYEFLNKIKNIENNYNKKEEQIEQLNNELSLYKNELFNKNKIISELNNKINDLNEQIIKLKNIINKKNEIIYSISTKNRKALGVSENSPHYGSLLTISKSCNNIISRKIDFKMNKKEKNDNVNYNTFKNIENGKLHDILLNNENNNNNLSNLITNYNGKDNDINNNDEEKITKILKKNSCLKKIIPNKRHHNQNSLKIKSLKKNYSYKILNYNSLNYSLPKIHDININLTNKTKTKIKNKNKNNNIFSFKKSFDKDIINTDRTKNDNIEEIYLNKNKIKISPKIKKAEKNMKKNNIIEFNNYSFFLNNIEKSKPNKLIYNNNINDEMIKNKKNNCNNTIVTKITNKKNKIENIENLYYKKNKLIEINKKYSNKSPTFSSNLSLKYSTTINPLSYKDLEK